MSAKGNKKDAKEGDAAGDAPKARRVDADGAAGRGTAKARGGTGAGDAPKAEGSAKGTTKETTKGTMMGGTEASTKAEAKASTKGEAKAAAKASKSAARDVAAREVREALEAARVASASRSLRGGPYGLAKADVTKFDPNGAGDPDAGVFGLSFDPEESNVVLVPVPWEATTSYGRGASKGPRAILEASPQLDLFDAALGEFGLARPWEFGIHMEDIPDRVKDWNAKASKLAQPIIAAGGRLSGKNAREALERVNAICAKVNDWVHERASTWLGSDKIVGLVGGDHSVSFGAIKACAEKHPDLGILHIDAHADLRDAYEGFTWSHASIMFNVLRNVPGVSKVVQVGIRDFCDSEYELARDDARVECHYDYAIKRALFDGRPWNALVDSYLASLPEKIYVSFDIDGLQPWLCPGTGTPVPGGLSYEQAVALLEGLVRHRKTIVGFDLNEVAPSGREGDEWDGNVGARLLYKLCGVALLTNGARNEAAPAR